jgi:hypothetical protein
MFRALKLFYKLRRLSRCAKPTSLKFGYRWSDHQKPERQNRSSKNNYFLILMFRLVLPLLPHRQSYLKVKNYHFNCDELTSDYTQTKDEATVQLDP